MKKSTKEKYMAMYLCRKEIEEEEIIRMLRRNLGKKNEQYLKKEEDFLKIVNMN